MPPDPFLFPNPYFRFRLTPNTVQTLSTEDVLESATKNVGSHSEFEKQFALFVHAREAVGMWSGRASLRLALQILAKSRNYEVVIPTFACGAVADAVLSAGGTPVLCDVKPMDGNIDPSKIKPCITSKTKAIVAVHYQGLPCDMDEIKEIGASTSIPVIEDCAHAIGSKFRNKSLGSFGDFAFYSFGTDKPITTGNGGMLTINSKQYQEELITNRDRLSRPSNTNDLHVLRLLLESSMLMNYRTYAFFSISLSSCSKCSFGFTWFEAK